MTGSRYAALYFLLASSLILMGLGWAFDSPIYILSGGAFSSASLLLMAFTDEGEE